MKATLEDVLSGAVEWPPCTPAMVDAGSRVFAMGSPDDLCSYLWDVIKDTCHPMGILFGEQWPASCDWTVEWGQEKENNDA